MRKKLYAFLLVVCLLVLNFVEVAEAGYSYELPYYGYCTGKNLTKTYTYYVESHSKIVKFEKKLVLPGYDSYFNEFNGSPMVLFRYITKSGDVIVPYEDSSKNLDKTFENSGSNIGKCPISINWEEY
ncbi:MULTISPECIES: hypothetical protein [Helcococcus]|uniref:DUF3139 domain-containing protein n=1 Tax=Helcococcus bovis TaxID=3153252 RepID=A0ABW9FAG5_9FIRM